MINIKDTYSITGFDIGRIIPGSAVLVLGARGTGKTTIIQELLYHMREYQMGTIMVDTFDTASSYAEHLPDTLIFSKYEPSIVEKLIVQQEQQIHQCKCDGIDPIIKSYKFLILDDLGYNTTINRDMVLKQIYNNGRHYKITTIIAAQYCMQIPKDCRTAFDFIFVTLEKSRKLRQQIYEQFDVGFPDEHTLHAIMQNCTKNHSVMVLDKHRVGDGSLEDSVFHFKAKYNRKFRVGSPELWRLHDKNYNPMYSNFKVTDTFDGKRQRQIRVRRIKKVKRKLSIRART